MSPDWIMAAVTVIGVPAALWQYVQAQRWKRAEWVAEEIKEFLASPATANALWMLDWNARSLPLLHPGAKANERFDYEQETLLHALSSDSSPQKRDYSPAEVSIRDCFDSLLNGLERFQHFVDAGLVGVNDLAPYLQYWLEVIGDPENTRKSAEVRRRLWGYIHDYGYDGVERLLRSRGYDIRTG